MSGIFDLLRSTEMSEYQLKSRTPELKKEFSKNVMPGNGLKGGMKPKGLSMRTQSDLNVFASKSQSSYPGKGISLSESKLKPKSYASTARFSTPQNKQTLIKAKGSSPCSKSPHSKCFKKPLTPRNRKIEIYPDPELLANYYDERDCDRVYFEQFALDKNFKMFIDSRQTATPFMDEGLDSDPAELSLVEFSPMKSLEFLSDIESQSLAEAPELPSILSDDDDDDIKIND